MSQKKIGVSQTKSIATVQAATMGHQTYVIPFDTNAQLKNVLDVLKLHNSHPSGYTDELVRYNEGQEFTRLEVGEELEGATVVAFKAGKAYRCPRYGPTLSRVVLVSNGGGRSETFAFLKWHLRSALPDVYVNGFHAVDAYAYDYGMDKRFVKNSGVRVENARIGLPAQVTDEVREANLIAAYPRRTAWGTVVPHEVGNGPRRNPPGRGRQPRAVRATRPLSACASCSNAHPRAQGGSGARAPAHRVGHGRASRGNSVHGAGSSWARAVAVHPVLLPPPPGVRVGHVPRL